MAIVSRQMFYRWVAEKIRETSWGLYGIADTLELNMLAQDSEDFGPALPPAVEGHLLTSFKVLAHQLNADTEDLSTYNFVKWNKTEWVILENAARIS